jgi:hypothetical protein
MWVGIGLKLWKSGAMSKESVDEKAIFGEEGAYRQRSVDACSGDDALYACALYPFIKRSLIIIHKN